MADGFNFVNPDSPSYYDPARFVGEFPRVSLGPHIEATDRIAVEFASYTSQLVERVRKVEDERIKGLLREAFEAGRERGVNDQLDAYWGSPLADTPDFDEWLELFIKKHSGS